ncbi:MAG: hypothetical protein NVS3B14_22590 [Ktedonobacteraceae bacterium]
MPSTASRAFGRVEVRRHRVELRAAREIAAARPSTMEELGSVKGVGSSKLQRYGQRVLRLLGL